MGQGTKRPGRKLRLTKSPRKRRRKTTSSLPSPRKGHFSSLALKQLQSVETKYKDFFYRGDVNQAGTFINTCFPLYQGASHDQRTGSRVTPTMFSYRGSIRLRPMDVFANMPDKDTTSGSTTYTIPQIPDKRSFEVQILLIEDTEHNSTSKDNIGPPDQIFQNYGPHATDSGYAGPDMAAYPRSEASDTSGLHTKATDINGPMAFWNMDNVGRYRVRDRMRFHLKHGEPVWDQFQVAPDGSDHNDGQLVRVYRSGDEYIFDRTIKFKNETLIYKQDPGDPPSNAGTNMNPNDYDTTRLSHKNWFIYINVNGTALSDFDQDAQWISVGDKSKYLDVLMNCRLKFLG